MIWCAAKRNISNGSNWSIHGKFTSRCINISLFNESCLRIFNVLDLKCSIRIISTLK